MNCYYCYYYVQYFFPFLSETIGFCVPTRISANFTLFPVDSKHRMRLRLIPSVEVLVCTGECLFW